MSLSFAVVVSVCRNLNVTLLSVSSQYAFTTLFLYTPIKEFPLSDGILVEKDISFLSSNT